MSKKRRTKKEKIRTTKKHESSDAYTLPKIKIEPTEFKTSLQEVKTENSPILSNRKNYSYVTADARLTLLTTSVLIALNLVVFILLKFKLIVLPGIGF